MVENPYSPGCVIFQFGFKLSMQMGEPKLITDHYNTALIGSVDTAYMAIIMYPSYNESIRTSIFVRFNLMFSSSFGN